MGKTKQAKAVWVQRANGTFLLCIRDWELAGAYLVNGPGRTANWNGDSRAFGRTHNPIAGPFLSNGDIKGTLDQVQKALELEVREWFRKHGLEDAVYWPGSHPREAQAVDKLSRRVKL